MISELIKRVAKAKGPDTQLDEDICIALQYIGIEDAPLNVRRSEDGGWLDYEIVEDGNEVPCTDYTPELTGSVDAVVKMMSKLLPGWHWNTGTCSWGSLAYIYTGEGSGRVRHEETAETAPLALLAAALKAL